MVRTCLEEIQENTYDTPNIEPLPTYKESMGEILVPAGQGVGVHKLVYSSD